MSTVALPTGAEIRKARQDRGLSLEALGILAGVHWVTIQAYETGKSKMRGATILKIVDALKKTPKVEL